MSRVEASILTIEGRSSYDEAVRDAQVSVDSGEAMRAAVIDSRTGEILADISPLPNDTPVIKGYSAGYADAWEKMMARRALREQKGQTTTTDA
jgi:hypothetical protein